MHEESFPELTPHASIQMKHMKLLLGRFITSVSIPHCFEIIQNIFKPNRNVRVKRYRMNYFDKSLLEVRRHSNIADSSSSFIVHRSLVDHVPQIMNLNLIFF